MPPTQSLTHAQFLAKGHGKTAPWLDLVNSEEWDTYGKRTEWLDDPSWLPFFLRQCGEIQGLARRAPQKLRSTLRGTRHPCSRTTRNKSRAKPIRHTNSDTAPKWVVG
jgi:putative stress-induced transcription regulator